jgi:hypothetical protein
VTDEIASIFGMQDDAEKLPLAMAISLSESDISELKLDSEVVFCYESADMQCDI